MPNYFGDPGTGFGGGFGLGLCPLGCYRDAFGVCRGPNCGGGGGGGGNSGDGGNSGGGGQGVLITGGGAQNNPNPLNQYLQSLLSGLALIQHAPYVPTDVQPAQQPIYNPNPYLGGTNLTPNTLGSLQNFIQKNSGAALLAVLGAGLFLMRPPSRAR